MWGKGTTRSHPPAGPPQSKASRRPSDSPVVTAHLGGDSEGPEFGAPARRWKASWPSCFSPPLITGPRLGKVPLVCGFLVALQHILVEALPFLQAGPSPRAPGPPLTLPSSELDPKDRPQQGPWARGLAWGQHCLLAGESWRDPGLMEAWPKSTESQPGTCGSHTDPFQRHSAIASPRHLGKCRFPV